jgi:hypothetical protein
MNTKTQLKSFVELCKRNIVSTIDLVEEYPKFIESSFEDAYEYFASRGMIQEEYPSKILICRWLNDEYKKHPTASLYSLIGYVMKRSNGKLNPKFVEEIANEYFNSVES